MKSKIKKRLVTIVPILLIFVVVMFFALGLHSVSAQTYFNSLNNSGFTKHIQSTQITESDILVYQKTETIIYSGKNAYHMVEEKTFSEGENQYNTEVFEYYYSQAKMYYRQNGTWQAVDFKLKNQLISYNFSQEYFASITFDKEIEVEGTLQGTLHDQNIKDVFGEESQMQNVDITIKINKNLKVQSFEITAILNNRNVQIQNNYTYNKQIVNLPI